MKTIPSARVASYYNRETQKNKAFLEQNVQIYYYKFITLNDQREDNKRYSENNKLILKSIIRFALFVKKWRTMTRL
jgi:hypothetical protein